jgi:hypothetical protein
MNYTYGGSIANNFVGIAIEIFQFTYVAIAACIIAIKGRIEPKQKEQLR